MPPIYGKARYMFKRTFTGSGSVWLSTRARARECRATDRLAARHVSARQRTIANFSAFVMRNDYANHSFSHITMEAEGGIRTHGRLPMQTGIGAQITLVPHTPPPFTQYLSHFWLQDVQNRSA